jgi:phosphoribosylformylglycinamidine synthase subunit PurQ / glutaminase
MEQTLSLYVQELRMQGISGRLENKHKIGIVVFPGSNCDRDVYSVLTNNLKIGADLIWHTSDSITKYDAVVIPGGFSYGDRLRAGIIAAHSPIMDKIKQMAKDGIPILGICNGFQILVESCLLPGALIMNDSLNFVCRWTNLRVDNNKTPFTNLFSEQEKFSIPVAHGQGRYVADKNTLKELKKNNQIVLRYTDDDPNGSTDLIAAICNPEGNVMGLMPHPERASEGILCPKTGSNKAINIFKSLVTHLTDKYSYKNKDKSSSPVLIRHNKKNVIINQKKRS